ncbi:MAG TPA: T9SS type A sorting domain-containing protein [Chitinophagaceae bacterium]|nr:T9SS type A sorting domain-containing protein [Chitinophagaceae bacterium]
MKKFYLILFLLTIGSAPGVYAQVLRSMTPRYNNSSVKGNIVFVANNIITSSGGVTTETPPGGSETNNGKTGVNIDIDAPLPVTFINVGSSWKYLDNNTRPVGWETSAYNDAAWALGNAQLGYGDGDETTIVSYGGNASNKYITTYFRKTINIPDPTLFSNFSLNLYRDDGAIVYVNGVEVARENMPAGVITHTTLASSNINGAAESTAVPFTIPASAFVSGNNTIAVEMHQDAITSSDLTFDLELIGNPSVYTTLIPYGGNWKYLDNNTRPAGWETSAYNDAAWASGNAQLGYGDGDETTVVSYGGNASNKYITTYFRKTVTIPNTSIYSNFVINLIRDDGAVVYVNGVEVFRENMPAGTILHSTFAASVIGGASETTPVTYIIPISAFTNGVNTIAVEMHQDNVTSSDISFDLELLGSTDETFNSSSADLSLPSCSSVLFAGLYWGASQGTDGTNTSWIVNENTVKLKIPGSSTYQTVTASQVDYHNGTLVPGLPHTGYISFADITSLVNATSPNGTYIVANVASPAGIVNVCGGWTIVIAYADPSTIVRNLTIFDGNVIMNGGDPALHVPITGFLTPPSGTVSCELGAVVYDGDRVSTDEYSFKQDSNPLVGTYTNLTPNATANLDDMWNSTISYKGSVVTTRNPAHNNTLGFDADIIDLPNASNAVLGNSQSSASIRFSSPSENYVIQVATTAISQYTPTFSLNKSSTDINGGSLSPGDIIRYQIDYQNNGNDASVTTVIYDNIPTGTTYLPNSLFINGVSKTDLSADDQAEYDFANNRVIFRLGTGANGTTGGEVSSGSSGTITFDVYTPSSCALFSCNNTITNRARISYGGKLSGISLTDSSGVLTAGCIVQGPTGNTISGTCHPLGDTILTNICPATTVTLPIAIYGGYRFYTGFPFSALTAYDPANPVTTTQVIYGFYDGPGSCDDTIRINVYITACPDIDDDDDGIPDYVELNNPVALQDANSNSIPNWNDLTYPGYIDNNSDGVNDNFDPSADSDNDGIPNFYDSDFPGYIDSNGDGVNDVMDKDLDGIPNHLDLDSDNDGIPDVVESFGVDANGDGRIDNYSDIDNDGLSQNVDGGTGGVAGSGVGLGAIDTDGDGIPNYLDLDSDNDGIPDIIEVYSTDMGNSGRVSVFADIDGDGYTDVLDADVGNDAVAENSAASLLKTGGDSNSDGRCDSWPNNNIDGDGKPNPYDLDSDGDGITDVKEAQFTDADWDGRVDGAINADGRNTALALLGSLFIPDTDGNQNANPFDIDSDDDGIPDNVEGLPTNAYLLPSGSDADGDGIDNSYDNFVGFGGDGIHPVDTDGDTYPDYLDSDTDGDGLDDIYEGNDLNFNNQVDDGVALSGLDTDGDGLDDFFDADNASAKPTSAYMGNGGTTSGDPSPGSITTVQHNTIPFGCTTERDWRCLPYVLSCEFISFKGVLQNQTVRLDWIAYCRQEVDYFIVERSVDQNNFIEVAREPGLPVINEAESYNAIDDISGITSEIIYYRLKSVMQSGRIIFSNIIAVKRSGGSGVLELKVMPNPARENLQLLIGSENSGPADIMIIDGLGRVVHKSRETLQQGNNTISYPVKRLSEGVYYIRLQIKETILTQRFNKIRN